MSHHPGPTTRSPWRVAALLALLCGAATAAPLDDIRRQVDAGQYEQAYQTAQANPQLIGDVHFDFLYGIAAINAGRVPEGLLALERHLAAVPANDRARLELAKGYYLLGEYARARAEFELVLRYNPPAGVRATINSFLQNMQVRENVDQRSSARLYAEVGVGHDNNVNLGTFHPVVGFPTGPQTVAGKSRQISDTGALVAVGGLQTWRVSNRLSVFAGADLDNRSNGREWAQDFDIGNATLHAGFNNLGAGALWRTTLSGSAMWVGHNRYRDRTQLGTEATWSLAPGLSATGLAQYAEQRFAGDERVRNGRSTLVGGSGAWSPEGLPWQPTFGARLTFQQEDNRLRVRADLDRRVTNLRLSASVSPLPNVRLVAAGYVEDVEHRGIDITWQSVRNDETMGAEAAANWAIDANWSLRCEASWQITKSNQDLFDTSRKTLALKLRYQY